MGKIGGIFGTRISGAVGQVVFRVVNGKSTVSQKPSSVKNPKTIEQQTQRMVFATCIAAYSTMKPICDHSFEGLSKGSENMARFMKLNVNYMKNQTYNFNVKGNPSLIPNAYRISKGSIPSSPYDSALALTGGTMGCAVVYSGAAESLELATLTVQQFHDIIGAQIGDQITILATHIAEDSFYRVTDLIGEYPSAFDYARLVFNEGSGEELLMNSAALKTDNLNLDNSENYSNVVVSIATNNLNVGLTSPKFVMSPERVWQNTSAGLIISRKANGVWQRSTQNMVVVEASGSAAYTKDVILPSYDPNSEYYLNHATR